MSSNENFTIDIFCNPGEPIRGYELYISFDESLVNAISVTEGDIFNGFSTFFDPGIIDNSAGFIKNIYGLIIGSGNTSNPGTFCNIKFSSKTYSGTSSLIIDNIGDKTGVVNETGYISISVLDGSVTVEGDYNPPSEPPSSPDFPPIIPPIEEEENNPPEVPIKPVGPTFIEIGIKYLFETTTFDLDDDNIRIKFDWGDGNQSEWTGFFSSNSTFSASYKWDDVSDYSVFAIAQDSNGQNSSWSPPLNITVSQVDTGIPYISSIKLVGNIITNESITFDASDSYDPDGEITSYHWDFGDGSYGFGEIPLHKYENPGDYIVTLTITDDKGNNFSKSVSITILESGDVSSNKINNDKKKGLIIDFKNLFFGILFVIILLLVVIFRKSIKNVFSSIHLPSFSGVKDFRTQRKIDRIDRRIDIIQKELKRVDYPFQNGGIKMESYIDRLIHRYDSMDESKEVEMKKFENGFDNDFYNYHTGDKFNKLVIDNLELDSSRSRPVEDENVETDINDIVDNLFLDKRK